MFGQQQQEEDTRIRGSRSTVLDAFRLALPALLLWACSGGDATTGDATVQASTVHAAPSSAPRPDGTLVHLEARAGTPDGLWGEASFKKKRKGGKLIRQLELDVVHAPPSADQALTLDGIALATVRANKKGSLEYEISEEDEQLFPAGFREPQEGSLFRVGELMELRLENLEKLTDYEALLAGPGELSGKVAFKVERLGSVVTREFQVKLEKAPIKTRHAVTLDGVYVGDVVVDIEGAGKLKFSTKEPPAFPADFPEPRVDSSFQVGELVSGKLQDALAARVE